MEGGNSVLSPSPLPLPPPYDLPPSRDSGGRGQGGKGLVYDTRIQKINGESTAPGLNRTIKKRACHGDQLNAGINLGASCEIQSRRMALQSIAVTWRHSDAQVIQRG